MGKRLLPERFRCMSKCRYLFGEVKRKSLVAKCKTDSFLARVQDVNGNALVTSCSGDGNSTAWGCGGDNSTCCGQAGAITIAAIVGPSFTPSSALSSTTSSTSTIVPTMPSTASSSVSPTSTSNGTALSVGAEAGIGVSVSLAGLAILGSIYGSF
jgi:hypothetical protein